MMALSTHVEEHPLSWADWTAPQEEYLALARVSRVSLFRAGNQVGKTHVGAGFVIGECIARRIEAWVVCTSWSQSVAVMTKVWDLLPKDTLAPGQLFSRRRGFGKDNPALEFANGSILRFRTTNQGAEALAGATVDLVWIDEPTDETIYRELYKRISRRAGRMIITMTPVNRDCTWLRKLVDSGAIPEVHARLDMRALTFARTGERMRLPDGTPLDQAWIDAEALRTPEVWRPVVLHGEWDMRVDGQFFSNVERDAVVRAAPTWAPAPAPRPRWVLGIDYSAADREFGQCVTLSQVQTVTVGGRHADRIHVADELVLSGAATNGELARQIITMLGRNGLRWRDLDEVWGDLPVTARASERSNVETARAVAAELGLTLASLTPRIGNTKEQIASHGSRSTGCRYLFERLGMSELTVSPRCKHLIKGLETWDYSDKHPYKDIIDSLRYALRSRIFRATSSGGTVRFAA